MGAAYSQTCTSGPLRPRRMISIAPLSVRMSSRVRRARSHEVIPTLGSTPMQYVARGFGGSYIQIMPRGSRSRSLADSGANCCRPWMVWPRGSDTMSIQFEDGIVQPDDIRVED